MRVTDENTCHQKILDFVPQCVVKIVLSVRVERARERVREREKLRHYERRRAFRPARRSFVFMDKM